MITPKPQKPYPRRQGQAQRGPQKLDQNEPASTAETLSNQHQLKNNQYRHRVCLYWKKQPVELQSVATLAKKEDPAKTRAAKESAIKSRTAQTIIENGRDLLEAKARVGHGNFLKWVEGCFPWEYRTAKRMMEVAENIKIDNLSNLKNVQSSALYLLAAPSTPEPARVEAG